jgi:hypothetical protein
VGNRAANKVANKAGNRAANKVANKAGNRAVRVGQVGSRAAAAVVVAGIRSHS